ncbi:S8 family serine peptidase [Plantactinospora sp. CA-290183]|uniref:S8 family serine peptidase n=1 Tax=Plantactinospora sp. CA-290183 TaxID=3240006 RepID=UPI003D90C79D
MPEPGDSAYHRLGELWPVHWHRRILTAVTVPLLTWVSVHLVWEIAERVIPATGPLLGANTVLAVKSAGVVLALPASMLVVRLVDRRPPGTVWSVQHRLRWRWLALCAAVAAVATLGWMVVSALVAGTDLLPVVPALWKAGFPHLAALAVILVLLTVCTASQQYITGVWLQSVGVFARSQWPAILVTGVLIPELLYARNGWVLGDAVVTAVVLAWLTIRTGGLEAAIACMVSGAAVGIDVTPTPHEAITTAQAAWVLPVVHASTVIAYAAAITRLAGRRPERGDGGPPVTTRQPLPRAIMSLRAAQRYLSNGVAGLILTCAVLVAGAVPPPPESGHSVRSQQWHLDALQVATAHHTSRGTEAIVAVIGTGVVATHPDLAGVVLPGIDLTGQHRDGRRDDDGQSSAAAGLIAARGHGPEHRDGALGIAPDALILPIRHVRTSDAGTATTLAEAVDEAVRRNAQVLTLSLPERPSTRLKAAVEAAVAADVVVVVDVNGQLGGAAYLAELPGAVVVGATGRDGTTSRLSPTGEVIDLVAPGVDLTTTSRDGRYEQVSGTAAATAVVAGAAALVRSRYPTLSASEVVRRLTATAVDEGATGRDDHYGYGALNLLAALTAHVALTVPPTRAPVTADPETAEYEEKEERAARWMGVILIVAGAISLLLKVLLACVVAIVAIALIATLVYLPSLWRRFRFRRVRNRRRTP